MPPKRKPGAQPQTVFLTDPISVRIPQAVAMTGLSRTRIYQLINAGELTIAKDGNCTLILVESLRATIAKRTRIAQH
jgi:hypothetical protein